jgi:DNA-binding response OmpR family regulator
MRILLVEDNFIAGLELHDRLTQLGHRVIGPLADVPEILGVIARDPPDAALLDFRLRDTTSIPIAQALRRRACPFVFVTGYGTPPALPPEFSEYPRLSKPIDDRSLRDALAGLGVTAG